MEKKSIKKYTLSFYQLLITLKKFRQDPLATLIYLQKEYGDLIYCPWPVNTLIVLNPTLLKELFTQKSNITKGSQAAKIKALVGNGLFSTEGKTWKRQRRILSPLFHHKHINQHTENIHRMTQVHIHHWKNQKKINLTKEITELTFNISGSILFGGIPDIDILKIRHAVEVSSEVIFNKISDMFPTPYWLPTKSNRKFLNARKVLDKMSDDLIFKARKNTENESKDLLSMMLKSGITQKSELRDQIKTMMIAGHDTTSTFILWALMSILYDSKIYTSLKEELKSDINISQNKNLKNILNESLRLFPPSAIISRNNTEEIQLGINTIKASTNIITSQYVLGRDSRIWKHSESFQPDRFKTLDLQDDLHKYSFFPFSVGPRRCVGESIAYLEASIIIGEIIKNYDLTPVKLQDFSMNPVCDLVLKPKNDFHCYTK